MIKVIKNYQVNNGGVIEYYTAHYMPSNRFLVTLERASGRVVGALTGNIADRTFEKMMSHDGAITL